MISLLLILSSCGVLKPLLTENEINHFFTANSGKVDVAEHLKSQHLQYGGFVILITQEHTISAMKDYPNVHAGRLKDALAREDLDRNDRISLFHCIRELKGKEEVLDYFGLDYRGGWKLLMDAGRWREWKRQNGFVE